MARKRKKIQQRTYDHEIILISETVDYDELGNPIISENKTSLLCDLQSIGRTEFYDAAAQGLKPEVIFVIHAFEYNGEQIIEYDSKRYKVMRTYAVDQEELEITCERVVRDG